MAENTQKELFNSTIYSVFVRNHTQSGDFLGLIDDLDRIEKMGIDTIWLMPIHPIGEDERKGSLGCPYSIRDYRGINPEYGTVEDFKMLTGEIHARKMKCMIDVVYNHTSKDSALTKSHPEYFLKDSDGNFTSKVEDWSDVADFDYSKTSFYDELIDTLLYWCSLGVDGFRCDVASLIPIEFWLQARKKVQSKYPHTVFLAESCGLDFVEYVRSRNYRVYTDSEIYRAFDTAYDYDIRDAYYHLVNTEDYYPKNLAQRIFIQNNIYPENAVKLRFLENHDNPRTASIITDYYELKNYTALMFFKKGSALVYAGQETMETKTPSLFEKDLINLEIKNQEYYDYMVNLIHLKKEEIFRKGFFITPDCQDKNTLQLSYKYKDKTLQGVFNLDNTINVLEVNIFDGEYTNLINNKKVTVNNGKIDKNDLPAYFYGNIMEEPKPLS